MLFRAGVKCRVMLVVHTALEFSNVDTILAGGKTTWLTQSSGRLLNLVPWSVAHSIRSDTLTESVRATCSEEF